MKLIGVNGKSYNVNIREYLIDWDRVVSKPQKNVKDFLYPFWKSSIVLEEWLLAGTRLRADIVSITKKVCIEVSPKRSHGTFNKFFHKTRGGYLNSLKRDGIKEKWMEINGFTLVTIFDEDIKVLSEKWFLDKYNVIL